MDVSEREDLAARITHRIAEGVRVNRPANRYAAPGAGRPPAPGYTGTVPEAPTDGRRGALSRERDGYLRAAAIRNVILRNSLSPGDILMLTGAVRDLALSHPGRFRIDVRTPSPALWEHNPHLTPLCDQDAEVIDCEYPLIHQSNHLPYHFIHGFRLFLEERLGVPITPQGFKGDIHLTDEEKNWLSQVDEITGQAGTRFWIIVSGGKKDFTAKWWDPARAQAVVDHFRGRLQFVQIGDRGDNHVHPPLEGVIDLVGKTDVRQFVRLMYHADGVVCPVTMPMHLAAAVETKPGRPHNRPCVVVAGGREPAQWEAYPHHQFLHTNGMLPCCDNGGCWKSRVEPLGDGDEKDTHLCVRPVRVPTGRMLPQCMDMITAGHVIRAVEGYLKFDAGESPPSGPDVAQVPAVAGHEARPFPPAEEQRHPERSAPAS